MELKRWASTVGMAEEIRDRLQKRIAKLVDVDGFQVQESKLTQAKEKAASEQNRIRTLIGVLNREDELHARYLKKLFTLENEIESASEELNAVRKKLDQSKSRLMEERW